MILEELSKHYNKDYASYTSALAHWRTGDTQCWLAGMEPYRHHFDIASKILVLGCSIGYEVWALRKFGFDAYGCDFSKDAIDGCKEIGLENYCRKEDVTCLSYSDRSFDTVMAFDILEHIPVEYLSSGIKECERVTKNKFFARIPFNSREGVIEALAFGEGLVVDHYINQSMDWWKEKMFGEFTPDCWSCWAGPDDRFGLENCFQIIFMRK